jgi:hypothetical protein
VISLERLALVKGDDMAQKESGAVYPTVFIGLGGTGKEILFRLRRKFYQRWGTSGLPCISYLWIDTDSRDVLAQGEEIKELDMQVRLEEHEKVPLLRGSVGRDLGDVLVEPLRYPRIHSWLHPEVARFGQNIASGAGCVRSVGRLTFFSKFSQIRSNLIAAFNGICTGAAIQETQKLLPGVEISTEPQAYLLFSVAGGTGGGIFLDTTFLLIDLKKQLNLERLNGVMLLPNVYYDTAHDEPSERSYGNAYAALKELEFFTRRKEITRAEGDRSPICADFEVEWERDHPKRLMGPPFSVLYVCEMKNEKGVGTRSADRPELFHMLADSLFLEFLPGQFSTQKRSRVSDLAQYLSAPTLDQITVGGADLRQVYSRGYATFGMSKIEIPIESIREACSARLAYQLVTEHWNRQPEEHNLQAVLDRAVTGRFDAEGLEGLFGEEWKRTVETRLNERFPKLSGQESIEGLRQLADELPARLQQFESDMVYSLGKEERRYGEIYKLILNTRAEAEQKLQDKLEEWLTDAIERQELGINALLGDSGLIAVFQLALRRIYREQPLIGPARKKQAEEQAEGYKQRRDTSAAEFRYSLRSKAVLALAARRWSAGVLYDRLREAAGEHAKWVAGGFVADQVSDDTKGLARFGDDWLAEQSSVLTDFRDALPAIASRFNRIYSEQMAVGDPKLSVRVFDPEKHFPRFYVLDFDAVKGKHNPVDLAAEHRRFLKPLVGDKGTTVHLAREFAGSSHRLEQELQRFASDRFQADFAQCRDNKKEHAKCERFVEVLLELMKEKNAKDKIRTFVDCALPMLRRSQAVAGQQVKQERKVFLGVPRTDGPYERFVTEVTELLKARDYQNVVALPTDDPTQIYLFVESYAFPLAAVDFVVGECHNAYYKFYTDLRKSAIKDERFQIPLHLSKQWEGEFDELKPIAERIARDMREALEVLSVGPVLNIIRVQQIEGRRRYSYRECRPPQVSPDDLGNKREAIERLVSDTALRHTLFHAVQERHAKQKQAKSADDAGPILYYWALSYVTQALFDRGNPEFDIIGARLQEHYDFLVGQGKKVALLTEEKSQAERAEFCKQQLGDAVDWSGGFPVLKSEEAFVRGRVEAATP